MQHETRVGLALGDGQPVDDALYPEILRSVWRPGPMPGSMHVQEDTDAFKGFSDIT